MESKSAVPPSPLSLHEKPFRFADLLPELRDCVYAFYFADNEPEGSMINVIDLAQKRPSNALTSTCRQIREESHARWQAADTSFWQDHRFRLSTQHLPGTQFDEYRQYLIEVAAENGTTPPPEPEPSTMHTAIGDFDCQNYKISNVTPLGHLVRRLHRLYLGHQPLRSDTTLLIWEALDQDRTKQCGNWKPFDRIKFTDSANKHYTRRTYRIAVVCEQDMLQALTEYLHHEWQISSRRMICGNSSRNRLLNRGLAQPTDDSEDGDVFMLGGSSG